VGRWWKLPLGVLIVLAIGVWDAGLPGQHSPASGNLAASSAPSPSASSPSSSSGPPVVPDVPGVLHPVGAPEFAATFTGSKLKRSVWDTCYSFYPTLHQSGCRNFGNPEESEWYLPSQDQVSGGMLHLIAKRERTAGTTPTGSPTEYYCRSGMISSHSFRFKYGYVQIVASIPSSPGLWPALWLRPPTVNWRPEIDMVESWGGGATEYAGSYFHPLSRRAKTDKVIYSPPSRVAGWHTFGLSWTKTQMTWLVDGKVTLSVRDRVPHQKMYIIANLAASKPVGPLNPCNGEMVIRSIDVWRA
jgi:beta-glucanase (GH16 family)